MLLLESHEVVTKRRIDEMVESLTIAFEEFAAAFRKLGEAIVAAIAPFLPLLKTALKAAKTSKKEPRVGNPGERPKRPLKPNLKRKTNRKEG